MRDDLIHINEITLTPSILIDLFHMSLQEKQRWNKCNNALELTHLNGTKQLITTFSPVHPHTGSHLVWSNRPQIRLELGISMQRTE